MEEMLDFLKTRKEQYIKRAAALEEREKAIKTTIANNEKAYRGISGRPEAIIPDEHGRKQLNVIFNKQNELLAKAEFIEELLEMYFGESETR